MAKFCKIFEIDDTTQVLVRLGREKDKPVLFISTDIDSVLVTSTGTFNTDAAAIQVLEEYSLAAAKKFVEGIRNLFKS